MHQRVSNRQQKPWHLQVDDMKYGKLGPLVNSGTLNNLIRDIFEHRPGTWFQTSHGSVSSKFDYLATVAIL